MWFLLTEEIQYIIPVMTPKGVAALSIKGQTAIYSSVSSPASLLTG